MWGHFKFSVIVTVGTLLVVYSSVLGQAGLGGYAGAYLRMGTGVRPLSLGGAFVAVANDVTAGYWNPAGLGQLDGTEIVGMYSLLSFDRQYNYAAIAQGLKRTGSFCFSWINLHVGNIEGRDAQGLPTGKFSDSENAYLLSYGKSIGRIFSIGGSAKFLDHSLLNNRARGWGFDAGVLFKFFDTISIGANFQDIGTKIKWDTKSQLEEVFPLTTRAGIAIHPPSFPLTVAFDYEKNDKQDAKLHGGLEVWLDGKLGIRAGYNDGYFTAGGSVIIPLSGSNLELDYGFSNDKIDEGSIHRVSLTLKLPRIKTEIVEKQPAKVTKPLEKRPPKVEVLPPVLRGYITRVKGDIGIINIGSKDGITEGSILKVFREIKEGIELVKEIEVGEVQVIIARENKAGVKVITSKTGLTIKEGDKVIYK